LQGLAAAGELVRGELDHVVGEDGGQQALGSPRTLSRVGLGRAPKASLVGANTVMPWALSTRSAFLTAVTSVDSLGHYGRGDRQDPRRQPRLDLSQPGRTQELALAGCSDAEGGLWTRLVIAPLVLDQPIVLGCRVLEHPEGIARRPHPRLRFAPLP
jgi:hypothetical protein